MRTTNLKLAILGARKAMRFCLLWGGVSVSSSFCFAADFNFLTESSHIDVNHRLAYANPAAQDSNDLGAEEAMDEELDDLYEDAQARREIFPEVTGGHFDMPPLTALSTDTSQIGNGRTPDSFRAKQPVVMEPLPESADGRGQPWNWSIAQWAAPNTFSYPLYFEDRMLERHGHSRWGHLEPAASGARYSAQLLMLPYLMAIDPACECQYSLGYYRSGSCAPQTLQRPPFEWRAAINQAIWMGGTIAIFP